MRASDCESEQIASIVVEYTDYEFRVFVIEE